MRDGKIPLPCNVRVTPAVPSIRPASGSITPASRRSTVVLPEPFGPTSAVILPGSTSSDTSRAAVTSPKRFCSPAAVSDACACGARALSPGPGWRPASLGAGSPPSRATRRRAAAARREERVRPRRGDALERSDRVCGERKQAEHEHPERCAECGERPADQDDDEEPEGEVRAEARGVGDRGEVDRKRPRDPRDRACRCDRLRASRATGRPSARAAGSRSRAAASTRPNGERARAVNASAASAVRASAAAEPPPRCRSVRVDDKALRHPDEPGKRLQAEGDRPCDDPRGGGEDDSWQPGEREADQPAGERAGDAAADDRRRERHAVLQQSRANDRADRNQPALREQRQPRDADHESKADRGRREVEAACQVGRARRAEHERCDRGERERRDGSGGTWAPRGADVAGGPGEGIERRHSTAARVVRACQATIPSPPAAGARRGRRYRSRAPLQCADVTAAWSSPSAIPAASARRGSKRTTTARGEPVKAVERGRYTMRDAQRLRL